MNMYPFSISTVKHVSQIFLMTKYFMIIQIYLTISITLFLKIIFTDIYMNTQKYFGNE